MSRLHGILVAFLLLGAVLLGGLGLPSAALADTLRYDFKRPGDAAGWTPLSVPWAVTDDGFGPVKDDPDLPPIVVLDKFSVRSLEVRFELDVPSAPGIMAGVLFDPEGIASSIGSVAVYYVTTGQFNWLIIGKIRKIPGHEASISPFYYERIEGPAESFMVRTRGKEILLFVDDGYVGGMALQAWPDRRAALFSTSLGRDLAAFRSVRIRWPMTDEDMRVDDGSLAKTLRKFDRR